MKLVWSDILTDVIHFESAKSRIHTHTMFEIITCYYILQLLRLQV